MSVHLQGKAEQERGWGWKQRLEQGRQTDRHCTVHGEKDQTAWQALMLKLCLSESEQASSDLNRLFRERMVGVRFSDHNLICEKQTVKTKQIHLSSQTRRRIAGFPFILLADFLFYKTMEIWPGKKKCLGMFSSAGLKMNSMQEFLTAIGLTICGSWGEPLLWKHITESLQISCWHDWVHFHQLRSHFPLSDQQHFSYLTYDGVW